VSLLPPQRSAKPKPIVCLLPGHFLGLLPGGRHLDHVPQKRHPTFFDQQGAVLVSCEAISDSG
jgi:hypothetical protein